jgi:hypothetical protein
MILCVGGRFSNGEWEKEKEERTVVEHKSG